MGTLVDAMRRVDNVALTANGALSNRSTLSDVLDYFTTAAARRGLDNTSNFAKAYAEDRIRATQAAFYVRDARGGQGERDTFLQALTYLYQNDCKAFNAVAPLVPIYGRWKDLVSFVDSDVVVQLVKEQLRSDSRSEHPSLLGKWMPSGNTGGKGAVARANRSLAAKWARKLGLSMRKYRMMLTSLRARSGVVEVLMSAKNFDAIDYGHVPSNAGLKYRKAFFKQDADRYKAFIDAVNAGEKTINAGVLYPYELTSKYTGYQFGTATIDQTVEALWKNLPNYAKTDRNALVIADVSGSMYSGSIKNIAPIDIAISLALYIAERNVGRFKDHFVTFSGNPQLQRIIGRTLFDRVKQLSSSDWGGTTNLQSALELILTAAVKGKVAQDEMPEVLIIVSDMQFNGTVTGLRNLDEIKLRFIAAGYRVPTIVFWNVNASRGKDQPALYDEKGVLMVAGASPSIFEAVINTEALTPMQMMIEVLDKPRYAAVAEALSEL